MLSMSGFSTTPLPESPVPTRGAWQSQTSAGSRPSQARSTSSCFASRRGSVARHGFHSPCSGHRRHAANEPMPARAAPAPRRRLRLFRKRLGGPILDVALQHLVLEILLLEHGFAAAPDQIPPHQLASLPPRRTPPTPSP